MNLPDTAGQALPIEQYALISNCRSSALVGLNGSIDWLCWPNFDSDACLAALVGKAENGFWRIAIAVDARVSRAYRGETMVLETVFETEEGRVAVIDFMPKDDDKCAIVRRVEGRRGRVAMRADLVLRFEYGLVTPWISRLQDEPGVEAIAGANRVVLRTSEPLQIEQMSVAAEFTVEEGETKSFVLSWGPSHLPRLAAFDDDLALRTTETFWKDWSGRCGYQGQWHEPVLRSLLTLKALSFAPTGGVVAAPTTSLPEQLKGSRNWDYRFCWLRDATLTLLALMEGGYFDEARAWQEWLHRAIAGKADEVQIMYGLAGERRLTEWLPTWLSGYQGASPVRVGNAASNQVQLDVYGEVMAAMRFGRRAGLSDPSTAWPVQLKLIEHLERIWDQPDDGIWEVRGGRQQFTHSKVMAWLAVDSSIHDAEAYGLEAPLERWHALREHMHSEICAKGFDAKRNSFMQSFGSDTLDASLLLIPQVGFLPADDPRVAGTVTAIEQELLLNGFVLRYSTGDGQDGLPPGEGAFLPCSLWLATVYQQQGRQDEARALFNQVLGVCNDVGLLAEEYNAVVGRQVGNFPQAFSHLALVGTALALDGKGVTEARRGSLR